MKQGTVLLVGRPNVGKSTFLNNMIGQKVAITSPKPQTTRFPIQAVYQDDRGVINFIDTPGIFGKTEDYLSKKLNEKTFKALEKEVDVVVYMVDHTRKRDFEEGKVLGMVRKIQTAHKILVVNKIDLTEKSFLVQYKFLEDEFEDIFSISALLRKHVDPLIDRIFELFTEQLDEDSSDSREEQDRATIFAARNVDSKLFVAEMIREKIFLHTGKEVPYSTTVIVDEIDERDNGTLYIQARILTTHDRYKKMLIGKGGEKVKDLGRLARKELELATNKRIYIDLSVETSPHWQEIFY